MFLLRPQNGEGRVSDRHGSALRGARLDAREWKYVAEGGANVLFRHHPPTATTSDLMGADKSAFYGKLLRVKKCDAPDDDAAAAKKLRRKRSKSRSFRVGVHARSGSFGGHGGSDAEDASTGAAVVTLPAEPYNAHYPHPTKVVEYATKDVLPYLEQRVRDNEYEQVAQLLEVDQRFLVALNELLLTLEARPAHRRQSQIDVALNCVMVLPDVTLPPPDEDPLLFFDETIDSEDGSESDKALAEPESVVVRRSSLGKGAAGEGESSTDQTADEELFDALAEELDAALGEDLKTEPTALRERDAAAACGSSPSPSSASTVTSGEQDCTDADADEQGDDYDDDEDDDVDPPLPRRRRMLSGNCNIFDCCFRNICVEIKPKIGFKPRGALIADVRTRVCRFCMHQHYKRATGKVEEISEYCPLDLFSRDADRIRRALRALQRTPQNNFKVFVRSNNDEVVNVITGLGTDALPKGVAQTRYSCRRKRMGFRHSCRSIGTENDLHLQDDSDRLLPDVVELLTDVLLKLDILEDLKKIQLLDHISVDGMWHLHKLLERVRQRAKTTSHSSSYSALTTLGELVESIRQSIPTSDAAGEDDAQREGSLARCLAFLSFAVEEVPEMDVLRGLTSWHGLTLAGFESFYEQLLQRFQVATTLKDCSLLLCLRRALGTNASPPSVLALQQHHPQCPTRSSPLLLPMGAGPQRKSFDHLREYEHSVAFRDMEFNCVVAIVDLDVKSHKSVDDYYRLDDKIVQHYVRTFGDKLQADACLED